MQLCIATFVSGIYTTRFYMTTFSAIRPRSSATRVYVSRSRKRYICGTLELGFAPATMERLPVALPMVNDRLLNWVDDEVLVVVVDRDVS